MGEIQVSGIKNDGWFWASPQGRENVNVLKCTRVEAELGANGRRKSILARDQVNGKCN